MLQIIKGNIEEDNYFDDRDINNEKSQVYYDSKIKITGFAAHRREKKKRRK